MSTINGSLKNFDINLFPGTPLITVTFNEMSFSAANGQKPGVTVDIDSVNFEGGSSSYRRSSSSWPQPASEGCRSTSPPRR